MKCDRDCFNCKFLTCIDETKYDRDACRKYYEKHRERRISYQLAYNKAHIEQKRINEKKYSERHKEQKREYDHQRWLKRKAVGVKEYE